MIGGPCSEPGHGAGPAEGQSGAGSGGRGRGQHRAQVQDNVYHYHQLIIVDHYHYQHNLLNRFGMCHAARVHGVILLNTQASAGGSPVKHEKAGKNKY